MAAPSSDALRPADILGAGLCIGCGACEAPMDFDRYGQLKPQGSRAWRREATARFAHRCPFSPFAASEDEIAARRFPAAAQHDARVGRFEAAYIGFAAEDGFRASGSSGGMASWVAAELLRCGLVDGVAHVAPRAEGSAGRLFAYRISRSPEEVRAGGKSRYYPIDLSGVLSEMRAVPGRYAVVGIPCFIKAIHLLREQDAVLRGRIAFTLGLVCGHMKSARFADSIALQLGVEPQQVAAIDFRTKTEGRPANWYRARLELTDGSRREEDWWHLVDGDWGAGFFQNAACDACDDVFAETADIAFGDAWVEPYASDARGTNVVVVRTPAFARMLAEATAERRLVLDVADVELVARTQAAGLRQRREGLAYRLALRSSAGMAVSKRVLPRTDLPPRRKLVYRARRHIARWSHRVFLLGRLTRIGALYPCWAQAVGIAYGAVTYGRGRLGILFRRMAGEG
ncbi:MAG: Coenzyme F420 hydrogenase/dehydrogenase, beta subunit C-terminal domain [Pseudomonadota bacterium]